MNRYSQFMPMGAKAASGEHEGMLTRISKVAAKPVAAGAIAYAISTFMGQGGGEIPFFGYFMSIPMVLGMAVVIYSRSHLVKQ